MQNIHIHPKVISNQKRSHTTSIMNNVPFKTTKSTTNTTPHDSLSESSSIETYLYTKRTSGQNNVLASEYQNFSENLDLPSDNISTHDQVDDSSK